MAPCGMEYPFGQAGSDVLAVSPRRSCCNPSLLTSRVVWEAEKSLALCKHCSASTKNISVLSTVFTDPKQTNTPTVNNSIPVKNSTTDIICFFFFFPLSLFLMCSCSQMEGCFFFSELGEIYCVTPVLLPSQTVLNFLHPDNSVLWGRGSCIVLSLWGWVQHSFTSWFCLCVRSFTALWSVPLLGSSLAILLTSTTRL